MQKHFSLKKKTKKKETKKQNKQTNKKKKTIYIYKEQNSPFIWNKVGESSLEFILF